MQQRVRQRLEGWGHKSRACLEHDVINFLLIIGERLEVETFSHELVVDFWSFPHALDAPLLDVA